jgi:monovalent cation:H+ antiporter, CPA1 family
MGLNVERTAILLLVASVVSMAARRLRLPYTVALVLAGVVMAVTSLVPGVTLTKELIFTAFLPPLVFEAAFNIPWSELRRDLPVILVLATVGVAISAALTSVGMRTLLGWPWAAAVLFGILIAATDPVSVIATFKETGLRGRVRLLVEAESLFNDGTAAVAFTVALAAIQGGGASASGVGLALLVTIGGGIFAGLAVAGVVLWLAGSTDDHLVEITFTTVAAYGSFLVAEHFHMSGVLAALVAGLLLGNVGSLGAFTDRGREAVESFWEYLAFVVNSLVFLLIGIQLALVNMVALAVPVAVAILLVLAARAAAVYPCSAMFLRSSLRVPANHQHLLVWGGLRGALALALALSLPSDLPRRNEIVVAVFGVVAFSVLVQGTTISPLLRRMGMLPGDTPAEPSGEADT